MKWKSEKIGLLCRRGLGGCGGRVGGKGRATWGSFLANDSCFKGQIFPSSPVIYSIQTVKRSVDGRQEQNAWGGSGADF